MNLEDSSTYYASTNTIIQLLFEELCLFDHQILQIFSQKFFRVKIDLSYIHFIITNDQF